MTQPNMADLAMPYPAEYGAANVWDPYAPPDPFTPPGTDDPRDLPARIQAWYQTYLGREASNDEIRVHLGNPGGPTAMESMIRDSPEGKAYAKAKATTPAPASTGSPTDPVWVEQQIKDAWKKYYGAEIPAERLAYWKGKALTPDIYSDGYWRVGWNPYWEDRLRTGSASSNPALAGDATKMPGKKRWEGYEQDDPANAPAPPNPASPPKPASPTSVTIPPLAYTPRNYGDAAKFKSVTPAPTQAGATPFGVTMTPEAYRKLVEAQPAPAVAPPLSALAYLPWQQTPNKR